MNNKDLINILDRTIDLMSQYIRDYTAADTSNKYVGVEQCIKNVDKVPDGREFRNYFIKRAVREEMAGGKDENRAHD